MRLAQDSDQPYDLVIIGGGINGCGVAALTARAGYRVALFEADDFGFGTTWRSTKLIHGGLRYLEHREFGLVFESLRERRRLLRTRPHLVRPQRFLLPLLPWSRRPAWQLRVGLAAYDVLSMPRDVPRHRRISRADAARAVPWLSEHQRGAFTFFDARAVAPERLAIELLCEALDAGAVAQNHTRVTGILKAGGAVTGVTVMRDGETADVPARIVLNAAGPWVDEVLGARSEPLLGVTRGTHLALEVPEMPRDAIYSTARSDGRVFFAVPQEALLLVGTTDDRYDGPPSSVRPTPDDIDYLLTEAAAVLPGAQLDRSMVRYAYAGLRPLPQAAGDEAAITRRHLLVDHGSRDGIAGLYSVIGGKLSTYRSLARDLMRRLPAPVAGSRPPVVASGEDGPALPAGIPGRTSMHLAQYGAAAARILADGDTVVCVHAGAVIGEVSHAVKRELASTLSDVLMRRTGIAWSACRGLCCDEVAAEVMAGHLGWSAEEIAQQVAAFRSDVARHLPNLSEVELAAGKEHAQGASEEFRQT